MFLTALLASSAVGNVIATVLLLAVLGGAVAYIVKARKKGQKCIGCPGGCSCCPSQGEKNSCCSCRPKNSDTE